VGRIEPGWVERAGIYDDAIADASDGGYALAATALDLFGRGFAPTDEEPEADANGDESDNDARNEAGIPIVQELL
jgi:hypothetical protein